MAFVAGLHGRSSSNYRHMAFCSGSFAHRSYFDLFCRECGFVRKKSRYQTASSKGIRENGVFPWKNVFGKSVCMAGIWRSRSAQMGKSFYRGKRVVPISFSLGGKEKQVIEFEAGSNWCGCIRFCFSDWKCQDFFRVFSLKRKADTCAYTVVMPERQKGELSLFTREGFDMESFRYSGSRPGDDPGETYDIREYRSGDSIRQIHWKLSGKLDDIMIREKSFPVDDTVLILAEAFQADRDPQRAETVAEVFSAVLQSFMEKKISCQAGVYDHSTGKFRLEKIRTEEDRENILYRFLRYGSDAKTPVTVREYLKDPGIQNFANYVYITGDPQDKEAELLAAKGEVTIVGCGTGGRDSGGEQVLWKYGSQNPKDSQKQHMENNCPVSCRKLH